MFQKNTKNIRICVFFSSDYPYETTLINEFPIMANQFDLIYYFPTNYSNKIGPIDLPENVVLMDLLEKSKDNWRNPSIGILSTAIFLYLTEALKKDNFKSYIVNFKSFFSILLRNLIWAKALKKFITKNELQDAFYYDYWFENATIALAYLKRKKVIKTVVSRSHRFDLYDESWGTNGKVPFRSFKIKQLDSVYTVALHGKEYFQSKVKPQFRDKIKLSYLGISMPEITFDKFENSKSLLIVSASNTRDFKRVDLIPEVLNKLNKKIHWVHFGAGPMDNIVQENLKSLTNNVTAEFRGFVPNSEVLSFLKTEPLDLFLSLSTSEGLPISMMESVAYGIPVFAGNVCGIPDLITDETGSMFELDDNTDEIVRKLALQLEKKLNRENIVKFARNRFDFTSNYAKFYTELPYEK
jgi:glycosyltransferase involved in cell wall biosynthesis